MIADDAIAFYYFFVAAWILRLLLKQIFLHIISIHFFSLSQPHLSVLARASKAKIDKCTSVDCVEHLPRDKFTVRYSYLRFYLFVSSLLCGLGFRRFVCTVHASRCTPPNDLLSTFSLDFHCLFSAHIMRSWLWKPLTCTKENERKNFRQDKQYRYCNNFNEQSQSQTLDCWGVFSHCNRRRSNLFCFWMAIVHCTTSTANDKYAWTISRNMQHNFHSSIYRFLMMATQWRRIIKIHWNRFRNSGAKNISISAKKWNDANCSI